MPSFSVLSTVSTIFHFGLAVTDERHYGVVIDTSW
jgi:hypothetical protein